jgi:ribonuclease P protein component
MVKLESLKKSYQFNRTLKEKKAHSDFFSVFASKNFYKPKHKSDLLISFVMKKKIGNAVKRNKIRRKLKAIVQKLLKKRGAISKDYTYIVFGKSNAYKQNQSVLMPLMEKCFKQLKIR